MSESTNPELPSDPEPEIEPTQKIESNRMIRRHVTPDPFHVNPDLLGTRLATPKRRGFALLIDLTCIAVFSSLGISFLIAIAGFFFARYAQRCYHGFAKGFSISLGYAVLVGGLFFFVFGNFFRPHFDVDDDLVGVKTLAGLMSDDPETVKEAGRVIGSVSSDASSYEDIEEMREELNEIFDSLNVSEDRRQWILEGLEEEISENLTDASATLPESVSDREREQQLTESHLNALQEQSEDEAKVENTRKALKDLLAGAEIALLKERERAAVDKLNATRDELENTKKPWALSLLSQAKALAEDIGITFFWSTLYFSSMVGMFRGRTIGKRLLGLRIVRLDGNRLTVWNAFERHGGYLAGLATGLLGFIQIYWDPNRQTIEDKIAGTVVIRD